MKKLVVILISGAIFSCSKEYKKEELSANMYQLRIAAVETNGVRSFSPILRVKAGKVAIEYEMADEAEVKEYQVEASVDGVIFKNIKTIIAGGTNSSKYYKDTVVLE